jgi:beta-glucanase (GH16 family)
LLAAVLLAAAPSARAAAPGWTLAWSDEFDGPAGKAPDPAKWVSAVGRDRDGWGNRELEYYCAPGSPAPCDPSRPNAVLDGRGNLAISARLSSGTWTSARLNTQGRADFRFGRIEARMRLPAAAGLWPAFWMVGADIPAVGWPACGEIDMMENVPARVPGGLGPDRVKSTLHGPGYSGVRGVGRVRVFPGGGRVDDGFHVYGAVWSPGRVAFYVDDASKPFFTATRRDLPRKKAWVFDKPFFLIMNLAVGGSWPKNPDASTPNPATMLVDWVRVYRRAR